jgi:hypothetical protein
LRRALGRALGRALRRAFGRALRRAFGRATGASKSSIGLVSTALWNCI